MIPLARPCLGEEELAAVAAVLASGMLVQGAQVAAFERALAARVGTAEAIVVANGTAALHLSLLALGIGAGDHVVVPAYSWPATANVVELVGAEPVFADVDALTGNLDPDALADVLRRRSSTRVRAIMPVHAFGLPCDMDRLTAIAGPIPIIEDAACALGATWRGRSAGALARAGCFSFHPRKIITTGEGGAVTTDDRVLAERLRVLRNHGLDPDGPPPRFVAAGFNARLTEFQAAIGLVQLGRLDGLIAGRRAAAARYDALLDGSSYQRPNRSPALGTQQTYAVLAPEGKRDAAIAALRNAGIEAGIGTHHLALTDHARARFGHAPGDFPGADAARARHLALPLHHLLTEADQQRIVAVLRAV